jgi:AraC family transcriptional regulator
VTGFTPHAYLANVRIDRARTLLTHTDLPITRIAAEAGYRSSSHFAHAFRGVTGESPRAYRAAVHSGAAADPAHRHPAHDDN